MAGLIRSAFHVLALATVLASSGHSLAAAVESDKLRLDSTCYTSVPDVYSTINPADYLHVDSVADAVALRAEIIDAVWGTAGFPDKKLPSAVRPSTEPFCSLSCKPTCIQVCKAPGRSFLNLVARMDELEIRTPDVASGDDYVSRVLYFVPLPQRQIDRLVIMHGGHSGGMSSMTGRILKNLMRDGYHVLVVQMPLMGPNTGPLPSNNRTADGKRVNSHNLIFAQSGADGFKFHLDPIAVAINHAEADEAFRDISMFGASGGGWASTLYAAIDPRVTTSISIAGSLPLYLRTAPCGDGGDGPGGATGDIGDAEQQSHGPVLYERASYLDLYVLAALGERRAHIQYQNQYDTQSFAGLRHLTYADWLTGHVDSLGGRFVVMQNDWFVGHGYHGKTETRAAIEDTLILPVLAEQAERARAITHAREAQQREAAATPETPKLPESPELPETTQLQPSEDAVTQETQNVGDSATPDTPTESIDSHADDSDAAESAAPPGAWSFAWLWILLLALAVLLALLAWRTRRALRLYA